MATEPTSLPVNGNYGTHQQYGAAEPNLSSQAPKHADALAPAAGAFGAQTANVPPTTDNSTSTGTGNEGNAGIPKDEVGWYFVEQYYTTLSRNPEKLHVRLVHRPCGPLRSSWPHVHVTQVRRLPLTIYSYSIRSARSSSPASKLRRYRFPSASV